MTSYTLVASQMSYTGKTTTQAKKRFGHLSEEILNATLFGHGYNKMDGAPCSPLDEHYTKPANDTLKPR